MSVHFLQDALEDINALIAITKQDIQDIKIANNQAIFDRISQKEELTKSFTRKKEAYAKGIEEKLRVEFPNATINDLSYEDKQYLLGKDANTYTAALHDGLKELKELNMRFGKMSLAVAEFYNSLLSKMVPIQDRGYKKQALGNASFLHTEV
ncbi:MAG: hypothetical protein SOW25_02150 [Helicobacter sp.]|nr:hypothetical protein [Helicobacteraceae bacterium]MDY3113112.1 hypothetical protein [Helicobacter sp.]